MSQLPQEPPVAQPDIKKPSWLKTPIPSGGVFHEIKKDLRHRRLVTVCEEAKCPNIGECWNTRTATFMVGGDTCTRACRFCHIKTGNPQGLLDTNEALQVAESCLHMGLKYVVITMVDRDDLLDGGAEHVAKVVEKVKELNPKIIIEFLSGDFGGKRDGLERLAKAKVDVFAHNIETVRRLTPRVRDARAGYEQSLRVLSLFKEISPTSLTKSAMMLGLGEKSEEVEESFRDLLRHNVDLMAVGQYMRPTKKHLSVKEWVTPEQFSKYEQYGKNAGFRGIVCAPLVRSSYKAMEFYRSIKGSADVNTTAQAGQSA